MFKLISETHSDIGGHPSVYEDRVHTQEIISAGMLTFKVIAVADGSGGQNKGERAAQTAIGAFCTYLQRSRETDIPTVLAQAIQFANKAVFQIQQETGGATTTFTAAVVNQDNRLFIANVGNGRVYLVRNQTLTQLTLDHIYANVAPWGGEINAEEAARHTQANAVIWKLGKKPEITVDLGFYVGTKDFNEANSRKKDGLPLQPGDAVLVCSDGLVKENVQGHPLITEAEIIRTLHEKEGKSAAKELVSFALGRGADDNISVALIQMPDRKRKMRGYRTLYTVSAVALFIIAGLLMGLTAFIKQARVTGQEVANLSQAQALTDIAQTTKDYATAVMLATSAAYTPTPTRTPSPTLPPFIAGQAGVILTENAPAFTIQQSLPATDPNLQLLIYHQDGFSPPGYVFAFPGSLLRFDSVDDQSFQLTITQGSQLFVETGNYVHAVINPSNASALALTLDQGCMAVDDAQADTLLSSCYAGACRYNFLGGMTGEIPEGQEILLDMINFTVLTTEIIPELEARAWISQLPGGSAANNCAARYVPTLTPTPPLESVEQPIHPNGESETELTKTPDGEPQQTPVEPTYTPRPVSSSTPLPPTFTQNSPTTFTPTPFSSVSVTTSPVPTILPTQTSTLPISTLPPTSTSPPIIPTLPKPSNTPTPPPTSTPTEDPNGPCKPPPAGQHCTHTPKP